MQGILSMAAQVALRAVEAFGSEGTFTRSGSIYDPSTGRVSTSPTTWAGRVWITDYSMNERALGSNRIETHDRKGFYPTQGGTEPTPGDTFTDASSRVWRIQAVEKDASQAVYTLQLRPK